MQIGARSFFASLALGLASWAFAGTASDALEILERAKSAGDVAQAERTAAPLWGARGAEWGDGKWQERRTNGLRDLRAWAELERSSEGRLSDPSATVRKVLRNPAYRDPGGAQGRSWAGNVSIGITESFRRFLEWLAELIARLFPRLRGTGGGAMPGLAPAVWALAGVALGVLLFVFIRGYRRVRRARLAGVLDDDEPDRTADEWLARADELTAQGDHRRAVRALYLAYLVRLDEALLLRFERSQTNWEHLARFEAGKGPKLGLDLRQATQRFDRVWYGMDVRGTEDTDWFRAFYSSLLAKIGRAA